MKLGKNKTLRHPYAFSFAGSLFFEEYSLLHTVICDSEIAVIFGLSRFISRKTRRFSEIQIIKVWRLTLAEMPNVTLLVKTTHVLGNHFIHPNFKKCLWLLRKERLINGADSLQSLNILCMQSRVRA